MLPFLLEATTIVTMPNVSNAEIHKLLLQLQEDLTARCNGLSEKIDNFGQNLEKMEKRMDIAAEKIDDIDARVDQIEAKTTEGLADLLHKISILENQIQNLQKVEIPEHVRQLREEDDKLRESIENRTNRQLRRTLIFKNIPETKDDESYQEVKALLADMISSATEISREEVFAGIERAHREAKREGSFRQGKRRIFAAFLNWDLPQKILDLFRKKSIADGSFQFYADQMYGPLTAKRRNMAFQLRKSLKEKGDIVSGFVQFPAKLMVNFPGDVNRFGKKVYKEHTNFSSTKVE